MVIEEGEGKSIYAQLIEARDRLKLVGEEEENNCLPQK